MPSPIRTPSSGEYEPSTRNSNCPPESAAAPTPTTGNNASSIGAWSVPSTRPLKWREPRDGTSTRPRSRAPRFQLRRSEEHTSELQSRLHLVCRLLLEKKNRRVQHTHV